MNALTPSQTEPGTASTRLAAGRARRAGWPYAAATAHPHGVQAARGDARSLPFPESLKLQDRAVVSGPVRFPSTRLPSRAEIAAGHETARLAATLAFFCSRSTSRLAAPKTGRLRV